MRRLAIAGVVVGLVTAFGCAAGNDKNTPLPPSLDGSIDTAADASFPPGDAPNLDDVRIDTSFDGACGGSTHKATQAPASVLFLLDASESMAEGSKWTNAAVAIVSAIDQPSFDTMSIGLLATPSSMTAGPECILGFAVPCGSPALPQVAVKPAGTEKSSGATGVRSEIYKWLSTNNPKAGYDATPLYAGAQSSIAALRLSDAKAKRLLVMITDGTASCASLSKPLRPNYTDANGCPDWEHPDNIIKLLKAAHDDPTDPVVTFVVGVPGADTVGLNPKKEPPYSARRALSAYAKAGAPEFVEADCDGTYAAPVTDNPKKSCHFDMTTSGAFDAKKLAANIAKMRGAALGCIYDLPTGSGTVDKGKVNVRIDSGGSGTDLKKRSDPKDPCTTDGCWDYTTDGKIELLGKACTDAKAITEGQVTIVVGCTTVIK